jgi:hypothetical protein
LINPHEHRHINTAHPTDIRVNIFGTSGFNVAEIIPSSVTLGGAHPVFAFTRFINRDEFLDETFVFRGNDINLPGGIINAPVTGQLTNGQTFSSTVQVFNRNLSFYAPGPVSNEVAKQQAAPNRLEYPVASLARKLSAVPGTTTVPVASTSASSAMEQAQALAGPVVSIPRRQPVVAGQRTGTKIPAHLQASMNRYLRGSATSGSGSGGSASSASDSAT